MLHLQAARRARHRAGDQAQPHPGILSGGISANRHRHGHFVKHWHVGAFQPTGTDTATSSSTGMCTVRGRQQLTQARHELVCSCRLQGARGTELVIRRSHILEDALGGVGNLGASIKGPLKACFSFVEAPTGCPAASGITTAAARWPG